MLYSYECIKYPSQTPFRWNQFIFLEKVLDRFSSLRLIESS